MMNLTMRSNPREFEVIEQKLLTEKSSAILNRIRAREEGVDSAEWRKVQKQLTKWIVKLTVLRELRQQLKR